LSTPWRKLSTPAKVSEFTPTWEGAVAVSGLTSSSRNTLPPTNAPIEAEKNTLGNFILPFTSDELLGYVERRNIGLARTSKDWIIRAARDFLF
jgi:hypothetical protein